MIGMQYNLPEKGPLSEVAGFGSEARWKKKKQGSFACNEPISVLDTRSPSPSTSTSTFSSSLGGNGGTGGGGSGSTDNPASLAAVSDNNPPQKWPVSTPLEKGQAAVTDSAAASGGGKDEWALELQPIPAGLEVSGGERFGFGLEDWESLVCESSQDQSLFRWISGEADNPSFSLKQLLQGANPNDIDGYVTTGSVVDQSSVYGAASAGVVSTGNAMTTLTPVLSGGGSVSSSEMGNCKASSNPQIPILGSSLNNPLAGGLIHQQQQLETPEEKPQLFNPQQFMNQQQLSQPNPNLFPPSLYAQQDPLRLLQPQPKRQNLVIAEPPKVPFLDPAQELLLRKLGSLQQMQTLTSHPLMATKQEAAKQTAAQHQQQQQQVIYDQLYKAAELMLTGNFSHAQGILARLNHQLSPPLGVAKPFQRAVFYFKEALQLPIPATPRTPPTPFDGILKMGAYKLLSEISPLVHFMNFTSNQVLLEALDHHDDSDESVHVHVIDFDIGFGAQWASFMQELPGRINRVASLKITALASPSTHHPFELGLMHENLTQFANEIGVKFELEVVNFDAFFDPNFYPLPHFRSSEKEAIVVNFPLWVCSNRLPGLHSVLLFIKQLSPKIMVSLENGCERADFPFSHHLLHALQYYEVLLDSIDAANATPETVNKIEKFLLQPRIENVVLGRLHAPDQMPHWKALFASAGFSPVGFSNFAESQAECVAKRSQVRGFHVEKRQASLVLCWQRRELISVSAWRC